MMGKEVLSNAFHFRFRTETDFCFVVCFLFVFFFFFNPLLYRKIFLSAILSALLEIVSFIIVFTTWNETKEAFNSPRNMVYLECLWKGLKD